MNSHIAKRIAILLFTAAIIPTMLMTVMSSNKLNQTVSNYEHQLLQEKTRSYALQTFQNLIYARNTLQHNSVQYADIEELANATFKIAAKETAIFTHIYEASIQDILNQENIAPSRGNTTDFLTLSKLDTKKVSILLRSNHDQAQVQPSVYLALLNPYHQHQNRYIIAELSNRYLWGNKDEYPENLNTCAYQLINQKKETIFCSSRQQALIANTTQSITINHAEWELFLNGEFSSNPWLFSVSRTQPLTQNHIKEFVGSRAFISIAVGSLLSVGLLSLIQIRRTMKPLDNLLSGTNKIKEGDYSPIVVEGKSEFSALASAFNNMAAHIKKQFETMQSYSTIDREIVANSDVQQVIQLVLNRMQTIAPDLLFCIGEIKEQSEHDAQCACTLLVDGTPLGLRLMLTTNELAAIAKCQQGLFKLVSMQSQPAHERLMAEFSTSHIWTLPIFWHGELYGFICVGNDQILDQSADYWAEFQELTNRIGTVIAAHSREQQLLLEAQYDNLTGLPNRILLRDRLKLAMEHSDKTGKAMWVVFIDLDRFKVINDSMGHNTGDTLLKEIAKRLLAQTRETDTVARFGGDEFVLVLSGDAGENIQISVLKRMMDAIAEPIYINQQTLINTCSIGIAVYPDDGKNAEALIKNADIAMYRAKELGRNNYQFFTQTLNDKAAKRMHMISQLRRAIEQDEFSLVYQPKVDIISGKIVGLEALIRWHHPQQGNIPPAEFIPVAEEAGLTNMIGEWVFKTACLQTAIWFQSGFTSLLISINLSAREFEQPDLVKKLQTILVETGAKASAIEVELTETALMNISDTTIKTLHDIKSLGIELSIDDFGTGYSNLSYLNSLPMDTLKIDKAFIDTISLKTDKSPIVDTIINLGKNMGLKVVAEGVETVEQLAYVKAQGCNQIQGYYFSKPVSAEAITSMLHADKTLTQPKQLKLVKSDQQQSSS